MDLKLRPGEVGALVGPSGSGKTRVVRAILGLESHEGSVRLLCTDALGLPPLERAKVVGVVLDDPAQNFTMWKVKEEVEFPLESLGLSREEVDRLAGDAMEKFGLSNYAERPIVELSGGEKMRLALLVATILKPKVLILDDPFPHLDKRMRSYLVDFINRYDGCVLLTASSKRSLSGINISKTILLPSRSRKPVEVPAERVEGGGEIIVRNVWVRYGKVYALKGVDFALPKGEALAVLGPNGSGKTTLGKVLAGIIKPTRGYVRVFNGRPGRGYSTYVPQFPERMHVGRTVNEEAGAYSNVLEAIGIDVNAPIYSLSRGERRLVAILSAMGLRSKLLILDEPTAGMDDDLIEVFKNLVRKYVEGSGTLVLMTHDKDLASELANHALVLEDGRQVYYGGLQNAPY